jgi:hypothetical protein
MKLRKPDRTATSDFADGQCLFVEGAMDSVVRVWMLRPLAFQSQWALGLRVSGSGAFATQRGCKKNCVNGHGRSNNRRNP